MKKESLFLVLFVCIGILLVLLYGAFELGVCEMGRCGKRLFGFIVIVFVIIVAGVLLCYIYECFLCNNTNTSEVYFCCNELLEIKGKVFNFYVFGNAKDGKVPKETKVAVYFGSEILKLSDFEDIASLECLSFSGSGHKIEKSLYTKLLEKNVNIIICKGEALIVVDKGKEFIVRILQNSKANVPQKLLDVSGNINISISAK